MVSSRKNPARVLGGYVTFSSLELATITAPSKYPYLLISDRAISPTLPDVQPCLWWDCGNRASASHPITPKPSTTR